MDIFWNCTIMKNLNSDKRKFNDSENNYFTLNYENGLCQNVLRTASVDSRDLMSVCSGQMMKTI